MLRRAFLWLAMAALVAPVAAQKAQGPGFKSGFKYINSYDANALTVFAAMTAKPDSTRMGVINNEILCLKGANPQASNVWTTIDWISFAGADAQSSRINWKNPSQVATAVNSPAFTTDRGYTGNAGTSAYLDTGIADNAVGNWTQNSAAMFIYVNQAPTIVGGGGLGQTANTASRISVSPAAGPGIRIHVTAGAVSGTTANSLGMSTASRTSATLLTLYRNGVSEATGATATTGVTSDNFTVFRSNTTYGDPRVGAFGWSGGLDATQQAALNYCVTTVYLTPIGGN